VIEVLILVVRALGLARHDVVEAALQLRGQLGSRALGALDRRALDRRRAGSYIAEPGRQPHAQHDGQPCAADCAGHQGTPRDAHDSLAHM
jgi:hypothetical protein